MTAIGVECNILISAAGRRPYLVDWFRHALVNNGVSGKVLVADSDSIVAASADADVFLNSPHADSNDYVGWLLGVLDEYSVSLALSINDFELSTWAKLNARLPRSVVRLTPGVLSIVEDKLKASQHLARVGILTPWTALGKTVLDDPTVTAELGETFVVKNRFGSGSRGMQMTSASELRETILSVAQGAYGPTGAPIGDVAKGTEMIVVQPAIEGVEYGIDIVSDLSGDFAGVLARSKLAMRGGETDKARSEDAGAFHSLAADIAEAVPHAGVADCDVIVDADGKRWVIDLNARIGGGYPFSHLAGADVPSAYVAWSLGRPHDPQWITSTPGLTSAKSIGVARVQGIEA